MRRLWLGSGIWCPMGFSPASVPEGFQRASGKPFGEPAGAYPLPRVGTDAPTTAREQGLQPYGAFTLFFRWRKKSVQKKASGTALQRRPTSLCAVGFGLRSPMGCPRARGVRCRIAPYRSLCSPPTLPAGRFGLRPRPHWGHASLRDSSLCSPAGKKALIAHFDGGARNVARNEVG